MEIEIKEMDAAVVVSFSGDMDLENSPRARDALLELVGRKAILFADLSEVAYIDSSGVASLVEALQSARKQDTGFALVAVSEAALRVFQLARLDKVFTIFPSLDDGLAANR